MGMNESTAKKSYSWELPPEPILNIDHEIRTQILIVGSGVAGITTALSAAEAGGKVTVISASPRSIAFGGSVFAFNSRLTKKYGIKYDLSEVMQKMTMLNSRRIDERQWSIFVNRSGEAIDWAMDYAEANGLTPILQNCESVDNDPMVGEYFGTHLFIGGPNGPDMTHHPQQDLLNIFVNEAKKLGCEIRYGVTAKQLIRNGNGPVEGVIAQEKDGSYTRYLADSVVLATGDYGRNKEMMEKFHPYLPAAQQRGVKDGGMVSGGCTAGDGTGHLLGLWAGGVWQKCPSHAAMIFDAAGISRPDPKEMDKPENLHIKYHSFAYHMANWHLAVNRDGERFHNEHGTFGWHGQQILMQPGRTAFNIYDEECVKRCAPLGPGYFGGKPITEEESLFLRCGGKKYDTLEEFAEEFGLPTETFLKTVDRYNELCHKGSDDDFFKPSEYMVPIEKPPFYGGKCEYFFLIPVGGLQCNEHMQALDKDDNVIPNLYYMGTVAGNFFSSLYTTIMAGANLGRTMTFAYITGKELAARKTETA